MEDYGESFTWATKERLCSRGRLQWISLWAYKRAGWSRRRPESGEEADVAELYLIRDVFGVDTDAEDWPLGVGGEEKGALVGYVRVALGGGVPLTTADLYARVERCARAALTDWLRACVVRAARAAGAEEKWHAGLER